MVFYDWNKIEYYGNRKVSETLHIIKAVLEKRFTPINRRDPLVLAFSKTTFKGQSFIINEKKLLQFIQKYSHIYTINIIEYVYLASFRRYADYLATKQTTLNLLESPLSMEVINRNKLLKVENNNIHFLLEKL